MIFLFACLSWSTTLHLERIVDFFKPTEDPQSILVQQDLQNGFTRAEIISDHDICVNNFFDGFRMMNALLKGAVQSQTRTPANYWIAWQDSSDARYPFEIAMLILVDPISGLATHAGITKSCVWVEQEIIKKQNTSLVAPVLHSEAPTLPTSMCFHAAVARRILGIYPDISYMVTIPSMPMLKIMCQHLSQETYQVGYKGVEAFAKNIFDGIRTAYEKLFASAQYRKSINDQKTKYAQKPNILEKIYKMEALAELMQRPDYQTSASDLDGTKDSLERLRGCFSTNLLRFI